MKALIETKGAFMLFDTLTLQCIDDARPSVVEHGPFLQGQMAQGNITILVNELPDEASDAEWAEWLKESDGDQALAIASYEAKFKVASEDLEAVQVALKTEAAKTKAEAAKTVKVAASQGKGSAAPTEVTDELGKPATTEN